MSDFKFSPEEEKTIGVVALIGLGAYAVHRYAPNYLDRIPTGQAVAAAISAALVGVLAGWIAWRIRREKKAVKTTVANAVRKQPDDVYLRWPRWDRRLRIVSCRAYIPDKALPSKQRAEMRHSLRVDGWDGDFQPEKRRIALARAKPLLTTDLVLDPARRADGARLYLGQTLASDRASTEDAVWSPAQSNPHLLVVGDTGSGKSVCLTTLVSQALASDWELIVADPKMVDWRWLEGFPRVTHYPGPQAPDALKDAERMMVDRLTWMQENTRSTVQKLDDLPSDANPFSRCLVIVDETTRLVKQGGDRQRKETMASLENVANMARAANVNLVLAMQRPDVTILPGHIREQLGSRIAFGEMSGDAMQMAFGRQDLPPLGSSKPGRGRFQTGSRFPRELQGAWVLPELLVDRYAPQVAAR